MDNTSTEEITSKEYEESFPLKRKALKYALDIRKFEIELYWKRAAYFWTFIAATMAGFLAIQASQITNKADLSVILSCLGLVFSCAWFCVNRGSKFWQENWEKHVDMLEDEAIGPLYKIVLSRNKEMTRCEKIINFITGPAKLSVSKINQIISLYVAILWLFLLLYSIWQNSNLFCSIIVITSLGTICAFFLLGKSYHGGFYHTATKRKSRIFPKSKKPST